MKKLPRYEEPRIEEWSQIMTDLALSPLSIKIEDLPSRPQQLGETEENDVLGGRGYRNRWAYISYMRRYTQARNRAQGFGRASRYYANAQRSWNTRANQFRSIAMRYR